MVLRNLLLLLGVLALAAVTALPLTLTLLALVAVIAIHEAGHYLAARRLNLATPEFAIGMGPIVLSRQGRNTLWVLRALPIGGFVRIAGMGEDMTPVSTAELNPEHTTASAGEPARELEDAPARHQRVWGELNRAERIFLAAAGPFANFVLSVALIVGLIATVGVLDPSTVRVNPLPSSPAAAAGVLANDEITHLNATPVRDFTHLRELVSEASGPMRVTIERDGAVRTLTVTPESTADGARLGVESVPVWRTPTPSKLASATFTTTTGLFTTTLQGLASLGEAITAIPANFVAPDANAAGDDSSRLLSPVGAARIAEHTTAEQGWYAPLALLAASSMFIGMFNLLPIPPLDGGHIAVAAYEATASRIRRRPVRVDLARLAGVSRAAVALILLLGVSSLVLDIIRPVALP